MAGDLENEILSDVNLTKKSLEEGVQHLLDWLSKQPHLPKVTDENLLKTFILGSKSVERAKERIDKYFSARTKYPDFFLDRDPRTVQWKKIERMFFLPQQTPSGNTVLFFKAPIVKEEMDAFSFFETCRIGFMLLDLKLKSPQLTSGHLLVIDCEKVTMEFLMKFVTIHTNAIFNIYQNAMPVRVKGCVCFNVSSIVENFFNTVFKFFFNQKLQQRYAVHSDVASLSKYFPLDMLPQEYGGNSPPIDEQFEGTKAALEQGRDWLMKEGILGSDEAKRPIDKNNPQQLHGTFRKLELD